MWSNFHRYSCRSTVRTLLRVPIRHIQGFHHAQEEYPGFIWCGWYTYCPQRRGHWVFDLVRSWSAVNLIVISFLHRRIILERNLWKFFKRSLLISIWPTQLVVRSPLMCFLRDGIRPTAWIMSRRESTKRSTSLVIRHSRVSKTYDFERLE